MAAARSKMLGLGMLAVLGLSMALSSSALATPPTDEQIKAKLDDLMKWERETKDINQEKYQAKVKELLADLSIDEMSAAQLQKVADLVSDSPEHAKAALKRLDTLAADQGADGAVAAVTHASLQMSIQPRDDKALTASLKRAYTHPGLAEAIKSQRGMQVFTLSRGAGKDVSTALASEIVGLKKLVNDDLPSTAAGSVTQYLTGLNDLGDKVDASTKTSLRQTLTHMYQASLEKAKAAPDSPTKQRQIDSLETTLKYVNGAFMRGELLDHPAPAMTFLWSSSDTPIKSLDQFKGKVVVLDFWATWCGPCRASFPDIAELKSHYDGYDVVVIGITSPQGYHIDKDHKKIDTAGDQKKEFDLMPGFMKDMGMTWNVAFTQDNVFNPEFGVRGIPHMAIIDAAGKVRYNGLHPAAVKLKEKAEKIDGLLKEAHLPTPAPMTGQDDKKDEKAGG